MTEREITILIVEDDEAIANGLTLNLKLEGFAPVSVGDGESALDAVTSERPALILLDIALPKRSGLDVLRELRKRGDTTPVIVLSARQDEYDKVAALKTGADDYVTKPFGVAELLARIDAVLRRAERSEVREAPVRIRFGEVEILSDQRTVMRDGAEVQLTHLEFELLHFLAAHPERVFTRKELLREVWGLDRSGTPRTVDNFVAQLRTKLESDPNEPRHLVTIRGSGYRFDR